MHDLRLAIRSLAKSPGPTLLAAGTLALGLGATTAALSVLRGALLTPLPYPDSGRMVGVWEVDAKGRSMTVSRPNFQDFSGARSFAALAALTAYPAPVSGGRTPERAHLAAVTERFFDVLGAGPTEGRGFAADERRPGGPGAVIATAAFARRHFGTGPQAIGRRLNVEGEARTIVGVLPDGLEYPARVDFYLPVERWEDDSARTAHNFEVIGRLAPGVGLATARAEMSTLGRALAVTYAGATDAKDVRVTPLHDQIVGGTRLALLLLAAASGLVLLVASANVANLLLARTAGRRRELAVRTVLGASPAALARLVVAESLALAALGAVGGLALGGAMLGTLRRLGADAIPRIQEVRLDATSLLLAALAALVAGALAGLVPALRVLGASPAAHLSGGTRAGDVSRSDSRWNGALVAGQVALATAVLAGAALLTRSFVRVLSVDPGFARTGVVRVAVELPTNEPSKVAAFQEALLARLATVPGVRTIGLVSDLPLAGRNLNGTSRVVGRDAETWNAGFRVIAGDYLEAMRIPVISGRAFRASDRAGTEPVALVNARYARAVFGERSPLGERIVFAGMESDPASRLPATIVGVIGDVRHRALEKAADPAVFFPLAQRPERASYASVVFRSDGDPAGLAPLVRREVNALDPDLPVEIETVESLVARSLAARRFNLFLMGSLAGLALLLGVAGLYGVTAYGTARRLREMGVRVALGATRTRVIEEVLTGGLRVILPGLAVGLAVALATGRFLASLLFEVPAADPVSLGAVAGLLLASGLAACLGPALHASRVDPAEALRAE